MSTRKTALTTFALAAATLSAGIGARSARADLTWEHIATVQSTMSPKPLLRVKMYNTWAPQRHRVLLNYSFLPAMASKAGEIERNRSGFPGGMSMLMATPKDSSGISNFGSIGFTQDLADDRVLAYESQSHLMISEPRRALMQRLHFNPWKKLAPELAKENPETLTMAQRVRLQSEMGALVSPLRKRISKTYFRELPGERAYGELVGKGYRLTQLVNVGGMRHNASWMRISTEWWIAPQNGTDADATNFFAQLQDEQRAMGGPTSSMWLNEMFALSMIPSDPILRAAWSAMQVPADAPAGAFRGTPLLVVSKVTLPPLQRAQTGDITMTLRLAQRNNDTLPASVFATPIGYKKQDIEPALKKLDPVMDGSAWISLWDMVYSRYDQN